MSKLPAMQFYVGDWRKDPGIQSLPYHDRGVWFEILCLMHESEQRGRLLLNGKPMSPDALARLLGMNKQQLLATLDAISAAGVSSLCPTTGALMNRRMVRDETLRKMRSEFGKMGGNPNLLNQNPKHPLKPPSNQNTEDESEGEDEEVSQDKESRLYGVPANVAQVIAYGALCNPKVSEQRCRDFFAFYESIARSNRKGQVFWVTAGENPSIIRNWKAKLPSFGYDDRRSSTPASHGGSAPIWQQIKSTEALIAEVGKKLDGMPLPNEALDPRGYDAVKKKRTPLIEQRKRLQAQLLELHKQVAPGGQG